MPDKNSKTVKVNYTNDCGKMTLTIRGKNATGKALGVMNTFREVCKKEGGDE